METHKGPRKKRRLPNYLTESQVRLLFQKIPVPDAEYRMAFKLMYEALLRVSEVCALRVSDLNFAEGLVSVVDSKSGDRVVDLNPDFAVELQAHVKERRGDYFVVGPVTIGFDRFQLHRKLGEYARNAGLTPPAVREPVHCHTLRHSGAREYLRKGILNVADLSNMLGHADLATTSIYLKTLGEEIGKKLSKGRISVD